MLSSLERGEPRDGEVDAWLLDDEDLRTLVGTMGRFPGFRPVGWRILERATVVSRDS